MASQPTTPAPDGVILVDKPAGMTSHDVVDRIRKVARTRRVGHTGTLDPMATGLLVICLGAATKIVPFLTGVGKEYTGRIRLGAFSSTYDAEGEIVAQDQSVPSEEKPIREAINRQLGWRMQLPPPYSAVKVAGKKLYEYARRGEEIPQRPRRVWIERFEMLEYREPEIRFFARVGSGTYIRSMAHDLGIDLGCGGYLSELRRTAVGHFRVEDAATLAEFIENPEILPIRLLGLGEALAHLPKITVSERIERDILNGKGFTTRDILMSEILPQADETMVVVNEKGRVLSIVRGEPLEFAPATPARIGSGEPGDPLMLFFKPVRVLGRES